ncbi:hypothetical protein [Paenibacillus sp. FSL R7-0272]|uniref:hypothetical protein n=1 Tax=Paenibacillus sp. FSL R7-0272 TaxID=2921679 RepID=UPI0030EEF06A
MNNRRWVLLSTVILIIAAIFIYQYYKSDSPSEAITEKVLNQDGYTVTLRSEHIPVEIFVKPEWINFNVDEPMKKDIQAAEIHNSTLLLDVVNRGNDIYFSFRTIFNMNNPSGAFIYNGYFTEEGIQTYTDTNVKLYDTNGEEIAVSQTGLGPGAAFSFGIEEEQQKLIKEGFYVKYNDFNVYNYMEK